MKKRLEIYALGVILFAALTIALAYTPVFGWTLFVTWPIVVYGWVLPMTPLYLYILSPLITLLCAAVMLLPICIWAITGRKAWIAGQGVLFVLIAFRFVSYAAKFLAAVPK